MTTPLFSLSKTTWNKYRQCPKLLWHYLHDKENMAGFDPTTQLRLDQGTKVGELARTYFPDGVLIDRVGHDAHEACMKTQKALKAGAPAIFEAAFIHHGVLVYADILRNNGNCSWDLIEVKMAGSVKDPYLADIAMQTWVCKGAGVKLRSSLLMLVDTSYVRQGAIDPECFFHFEDVSNLISDVMPDTLKVDEAIAVAKKKSPPKVATGPHCEEPYECPFMHLCHDMEERAKPIPTDHVRVLGSRKARKLEEQGIEFVHDIPKSFKLSPIEDLKRTVATTGKPHIDPKAITAFLKNLEYPVRFLDFETYSPVIPTFDGCKPYEAIPFQFSLWIQEAPDKPARQVFNHLHSKQGTDPRADLVDSLLSFMGPRGSIVAYNSTFEATVLNRLADATPEFGKALLNVRTRLCDLAVPFEKHYIHPEFRGRYSIKNVLPALFPKLSYKDLAIGEGLDASATWHLWHLGEYEGDENKLFKDLINYCSRDVEGMTALLRFLMELKS